MILRSRLSHLIGVCLALGFVAAVHEPQGTVWVVDDNPGPGVDFTNLQAAVNAAADGDVLLVQEGTYVFLVVSGKALTVQAEVGALVVIQGSNLSSSVTALSTTQSVHLRGLSFSSTDPFQAGLEITDDLGPVWVEDCVASYPWSTQPGLRVRDASVALIRTIARGGIGQWSFLFPAERRADPALSVDAGGDVHAYGSSFLGSDGTTYPFSGTDWPQWGGFGIGGYEGSFVLLSGSQAIGGQGGNHPWQGCAGGGSGLATSGESLVLEPDLHGGPDGCGSGFLAPDHSGNVGFLAGKALRFEASSPVREGESVVLSFEGPPWTPVYLATGSGPNAHFVENVRGTVLVSELAQIEFVGFTGADGTLETIRDLSDLPDGVDSTLVFYQALYVTAAPAAASMLHDFVRRLPRFVLGAGSMVVQLDEQF